VTQPKPVATAAEIQPPPKIEHIDIAAQLDRLEETILTNPRVPLTGKTIVNEEELLEQLDAIRLNLPASVQSAAEILHYREQIVHEAQNQARQIIAAAEREAYQIANELAIVDRAEQQARQILQTTMAECARREQESADEIERMQADSLADIKQMRQQILQECQEIQADADDYADGVLGKVEYQLSDILQVIQQGRLSLKAVES
jgi:cell division septum initiation protein DivIVA